MPRATPPLVIAHRGASKYAPENTLAAIRLAAGLPVDGIEIDVQLSEDKIPVVIHAGELAEFTTTYGFVHRTPLRALKTIDVGSHFGAAFRQERIPTLDEALTAAADSRLIINLELKPQPSWHFGIEERTVRIVQRLGLGHRVVFSSFSVFSLVRLRYLAPEIPRALLGGSGAFSFVQARIFGRFANIANFHAFEGALDGKVMAGARRRGWQVWAWTVNARPEIERMLRLGVDGIITDDPRLVREIIDTMTTDDTSHGI